MKEESLQEEIEQYSHLCETYSRLYEKYSHMYDDCSPDWGRLLKW